MNDFTALTVVPFLIALVCVLIAGKPVIAMLASRKAKQPISPDAPEKHRLKHGTPTMGGLLILGATALATLVMMLLPPAREITFGADHSRLLGVLAVFLAAGVIGFLDDLGKARKKENKAGLSERAKLGLQLAVAGGYAVFLYLTPLSGAGPSETTTLHFGFADLDLGWLYYGFAVLLIAFLGNATNFTDGLDGLSSGTTLIVSGAMALTVGGLSHDIAVFYGALAGGCAGFLFFNAYPARAFMGDTGSLALGMGLAAAALAAKQETLLVVVGLIYIVEIFSMMIQRYVFKYRRIRFGLEYAQKNRVFRRAPLHHHFEELGWHEVTVVGRFWVVALIAAAVGLMIAPWLVPASRVGVLP